VSELEPAQLLPLLHGSFGDPYLYAVETPSTQDVLRDGDHPHGAVAVAEHQTAGRGRSGRSWEDTASTALLFSVMLRPATERRLPELSLVAGLAVACALEAETGSRALVKWPNDVLLDERKVAGILLEAAGDRVVCGIGINVNQEELALPAQTRTPATSIRLATGTTHDRGSVLAGVLAELDRFYETWLRDGLDPLVPELEQRNAIRGWRVRVGGVAGTAGAIAPDGRLSIRLDRGDEVLVESGEVELVRDRSARAPD
jgi:BirA family transcriptional regulator, biotin operon repressor / biotin---[acetyl-CoA-carboxylase] ligase